MNKTLTILLLAIGLQIGVLGSVYGRGIYPRLTGEEVLLRVTPVDPRDYFMGQYVALNYDISALDPRDFETVPARIRRGQRVYVPLVNNNGQWSGGKASLEKPKEGLFIEGIAQSKWERRFGMQMVRVSYGIERYYAAPETAVRIERERHKSAKIAVAPNGQATLLEVSAK